ncbi:MAG: hypothetical protein OEZ39_17075 [Gammaproteobacteria bacterium]|nr:hypothetical protein [Gammaproteobacteria bacterium]MDH5653575.1 hypothetical protein [Gammaproteobacteria bacterium]
MAENDQPDQDSLLQHLLDCFQELEYLEQEIINLRSDWQTEKSKEHPDKSRIHKISQRAVEIRARIEGVVDELVRLYSE